MKSGKGFTLAEMLVVMAITVIFAAAAIPFTGTQIELARNKERETRLYMAMESAALVALKQSRTTSDTYISVPMSEETLQDLKDGTKSADLEISSEGKAAKLTKGSIPETVDKVKYKFENKGSGILIFYSIVFETGATSMEVPAT
jgi:prepilin-type N-terminal cleavage/methylation domain-containing protein